MRVQILNATGLLGKADTIMHFAKSNNIDIAVTMETWLAAESTIPLRPHLINITNDKTGLITGGHRAQGGILVNSFSHAYRHFTCSTLSALNNCAVVIETADLTLIFAYLPPSLPDT